VLVVFGEVCGAPAVNRCADVLGGGDQDGADDEQ